MLSFRRASRFGGECYGSEIFDALSAYTFRADNAAYAFFIAIELL